jgi:hypothetical protein
MIHPISATLLTRDFSRQRAASWGPDSDGILGRLTEQAKLRLRLSEESEHLLLGNNVTIAYYQGIREPSDAAVFPLIGSRAERLAEMEQA